MLLYVLCAHGAHGDICTLAAYRYCIQHASAVALVATTVTLNVYQTSVSSALRWVGGGECMID